MKNKLILTLLTLLFAFAINGQSTRQYVSLSIGPSFPLGDFLKTDLNDSTSGWAKTGVALQVAYAYRFTHNFGITAIISYSGNGFNIAQYKSALENAHQDTMFSVQSGSNWGSGGIMVGPYLRFPLSDKLSWDFRGLVGFYGSNSPRVTIKATTADGEKLPEYFRQAASAISFGWQVGSGFKLKLNKYYVLLFADYISSTLEFNNATGWDWDNEPYETTFKQDISYLAVTIGLGYFF